MISPATTPAENNIEKKNLQNDLWQLLACAVNSNEFTLKTPDERVNMVNTTMQVISNLLQYP